MTDTYKILGQQKPAANVVAQLVQSPSATNTSLSALSVVNTGASSATYSVYAVPSAELSYTTEIEITGTNTIWSVEEKHALVKDKSITSGSHHELTGGLTLDGGDCIFVESNGSSTVFNAYGVEIS